MTIEFVCPRCTLHHSREDHEPGVKFQCSCGQRLQVPECPPTATEGVIISSVPHRNDPYRRLLILLLLFMLVGAAAGLGWLAWTGKVRVPLIQQPVGEVVEKRSEPKIKAEELVRRWIVNNAEGLDLDSVEFTEWGPHMSWAELEALSKEAGAPIMLPQFGFGIASFKFDYIIRVRYQEKGAIPKRRGNGEGLFVVNGSLVSPSLSGLGPNWKSDFRKTMAKVYPAINP